MDLKLLNIVVFAEDFGQLVQWYMDALNLEIIYEERGEYSYTELGYDQQIVVGITPAKEMEHVPTKPRNNSAIMQLSVSDIKATFKQIEEQGGSILFGPTFEERNKFYFGGATDTEGNQIWFIQEAK